jgi:fructoselysine 6-phosphate deglycase
VEDLSPTIDRIAQAIVSARAPRLYFVGCGASFSALYGAKYLLDRFTTVCSELYNGWQFTNRKPFALSKESFVFATSYSGQTPEVVEAKRIAAEASATTIAITNGKATPFAVDADYVVDYQSKAVYTAPLAVLYLLCAQIMKRRNESVATADEIISGLRALPGKLSRLAEQSRPSSRKLAEEFMHEQGFYVLGAGPLFGLAYKLSLSVIIENLWIDGCPIDSGEFYHGPMEIVPPRPDVGRRMAILHLVGTDSSRTVSEQVIRFCQKHNVRQLVFDAREYPEFGELLSPFALFVPTEWFVSYMAALKKHDVDERRYMGKIGAYWGDYGVL